MTEMTAKQDTAAALRGIVAEMGGMFFEREETVRVLVSAVLAGQHSLMLGPPGTAKSAIARELTSRLGGRYWEVLLSKFTAPTQLFGPIDVPALMAGEYRQVFDGRATTCDIAFMDEIFKCGPAALNSTLGLLNERLYHPEAGGDPIACPLIAAITASNELPSGEESAAIYDRLLVRIEVDYLADPSNFAALVRSAVEQPAAPARTTVELAALRRAVEVEVPAVTVPDGVVDLVCSLRAALRAAELTVSDRRWHQAVRLMQAAAYLNGRDTVADVDLSILAHVLWDAPEQRTTVERALLELINPAAREALDLSETVEGIAGELDQLKGRSDDEVWRWAQEANRNLHRLGKKLERLTKEAATDGRSTVELERVSARSRAVLHRVMIEALDVQQSDTDED